MMTQIQNMMSNGYPAGSVPAGSDKPTGSTEPTSSILAACTSVSVNSIPVYAEATTLPPGKYAIRTKWILKNKRDARGIVVRNKERLVAQGHRQEEGIDYDEMDVKSAFLYEEIKKEV
nr:hypothetical protein [Tanacetum cinerariifolium]